MISKAREKRAGLPEASGSQLMNKRFLSPNESIWTINKNIDYHEITELILPISGARYALLLLRDNTNHTYQTVAFAGNKHLFQLASRLLEIPAFGKSWKLNPQIEKKLQIEIITVIRDLKEVSGLDLSEFKTRLLCKIFNIGEICIVQIKSGPEILGNFILAMPGEKSFQHYQMVESYARQAGLMISQQQSKELNKNGLSRYQTLFHHLPQGFSLHELIRNPEGKAVDFRFLDMNAAYGTMMNIDPEEFMGSTMLEKMPELNSVYFDMYVKSATTGQPIQFDYFDNSLQKHLNVSIISPCRDQFAIILLDSTAWKNTTQELRKTNSHLTTLMNCLPVAVIFENDSRKISFINQMFCQLFSIPADPSEVIGADCREAAIRSCNLFSDPENFIHRIDEIINSQKPVFDEILNLKDGRFFSRSYSPVFSEGEIIGHLWQYRDITRHKLADDLLRESEEKYKKLNHLYRLMSDNLPDMLWAKDLAQNYIYANKAICEQLLNASSCDEVIGKNDIFFAMRERLSHPENKEWHTFGEICGQTDLDVIQTGKPGQFDEYGYVKGKFLYLDVRKSPIFDEDGKMIGVVGSGRDVSQQKAMEQDLIKAKLKAEESDRLKSAFLANMSHEIRTPMNGIIGFAELLNRPNITPEKRKKYASIVIERTHQLLQILDDILDISKIETGMMEIKPEKVNINLLLQQLFDFYLMRSQKQKLEIQLTTDLEKGADIILADPVKLRQILDNLLNNAFKFTSEGKIHFGYTQKDNCLEFFVEDTGIGIPDEMQFLIFERFRQAENSLTQKHGGTGLGLSIARKLTELMGGKIWVNSQSGAGSTFFFTLPYTSSVEDIHTSPDLSISNQNNASIKSGILIAEDDEVNLLYLEEILEEMNVTVYKAENGKKAVDLVRENPDINLILLDIKMPVMNGLDAMKEIQQIRPNLPIIVQTAYALASEREQVIQEGCAEYITKPIQRELLQQILQEYLRHERE